MSQNWGRAQFESDEIEDGIAPQTQEFQTFTAPFNSIWKNRKKIRKYHTTEYLLRLHYEQLSQIMPRWYRICYSKQRFPDQIRPGNVHTSKQSGLRSRFLSKQLFRRHAFMNNNRNFRFIYLHVRSTPRRKKRENSYSDICKSPAPSPNP
jgi:hypothetical protein